MNTRSVAKTSIIVLAVPFSAVGATWLLYLLGYNMSIRVWVGLIALLGVDAETGVFMKRIAAPMIGGIFTSFVLELVVYPAIYEIWKWHFGLKRELSLATAVSWEGAQSRPIPGR